MNKSKGQEIENLKDDFEHLVEVYQKSISPALFCSVVLSEIVNISLKCAPTIEEGRKFLLDILYVEIKRIENIIEE